MAEHLAAWGFNVIPVNPNLTHWNGRPAYPDLRSVHRAGIRVDLVDVFRRPEEVGGVTDEAIAIGAKAIWYQLGVVNEAAAAKAKAAGLVVVMDRCTKVEYQRLVD